MRIIRAMLIGYILTLLCTASWAIYGVRISDLSKTPLPENPIKVWGKVTSSSPIKLSDGRAEITVSGLTASVGDFLIITGNWAEGVLTANGPVESYIGPAQIPMIYIQAGSFLMGNSGVCADAEYAYCSDEFPQHSVALAAYSIGKYEVTRGQYRQFMNAGGYISSSYWSTDGWSWKVSSSRTEPDYWAASQDWGLGTFTQADNSPVVGVSYYEAEAFCNWAGGHLPTEAQWEKAARWNPTTNHSNVYPWGDTWDVQKCNSFDDTPYINYQTTPVGVYPSGASHYGCQDMAGNVSEWCLDRYDGSYYSQTPSGGWDNPQGPASGNYRVLRGGSWYNGFDNYFRCACRDAAAPYVNAYFCWFFGFRLAR